DAETWIGGAQAIDQGFADELLPADQVTEGEAKTSAAAVRRLESALRASGMSKNEAMRLISEFKAASRDASGDGERDATRSGLSAALRDTAALAASLINLGDIHVGN